MKDNYEKELILLNIDEISSHLKNLEVLRRINIILKDFKPDKEIVWHN